jgi:hypothetical protein
MENYDYKSFGSSIEAGLKDPHRAPTDSWTVDDFVAVEASKLNSDQQLTRQRLQRLQHQSLAAYRIQ